LIDGDIDNPNQKTESLKELLTFINDNNNSYCDQALLVGPSGFLNNNIYFK
jgi:hypothetical protein